ncbi:hypothetical protein [Nonomuraea jabiensis]|uniref:hypothetical protein n=1 Tax=Nonomuraea jabiensis TaxID=882448 RepID=UPI003D7414D1
MSSAYGSGQSGQVQRIRLVQRAATTCPRSATSSRVKPSRWAALITLSKVTVSGG